MIVVRFDAALLRTIKHDILHSIRMIEALKKAGVPIDGTLLFRGVTRGTMIWQVEEDIDGDSYVLSWFDDSEPLKLPHPTGQEMLAQGSGDGYKWQRFGFPDEEEF